MSKKDYSNAKIYKLCSDHSDLVYVGATCKPLLCQRMSWHKSDYKKWLNNNEIKKCTAIQLMKFDDVRIELLESCPCKTQDELNAYEQKWINASNCVNIKNPSITDNLEYKIAYGQQYRENSRKDDLKREEMILYKKNYYQNNKEKILANTKDYYNANKEKMDTYKAEWQRKKRAEKKSNIVI